MSGFLSRPRICPFAVSRIGASVVPPLSLMSTVSVPASVNEDQIKAMAKKAGAAALDIGKKAPCHSSVHLRCISLC